MTSRKKIQTNQGSNKSMHQKALKQPKKATVLILGVAVLVAIILGLFLLNLTQARKDANRFAEAEKNMQLVFDALVQKIGTPIQTETKNVCYNSEQGPYDDGRLWCQVASAAYFSIEKPEEGIRSFFEETIDSNNLRSRQSESHGLIFYGGKDLLCALWVYEGALATKPGFYLLEATDAKQTLVVRCADRAKAKHYPYFD